MRLTCPNCGSLNVIRTEEGLYVCYDCGTVVAEEQYHGFDFVEGPPSEFGKYGRMDLKAFDMLLSEVMRGRAPKVSGAWKKYLKDFLYKTNVLILL